MASTESPNLLASYDSKSIHPVKYENIINGSRILFSDGTVVHRPFLQNPSVMRPVGALDSGQVSAYHPAQYIKPQARGIIGKVQGVWNRFANVNPAETTEQGASSAASPVTFYLTLWQQRFGRRAMIEDCRALQLSDPRIMKSVNMFVAEACRGGVICQVYGDSRIAKRARFIAQRVMKLFPPQKLRSWARGLLLEGDLFVQYVLDDDGRLVKCKRMPSISMERCSNDADEFDNPLRAFEQIDSMTFETVAPFAESLICHTRWNNIDGDRYGVPDIVAIRRTIRFVGQLEQSQGIRRMVRAGQKRLHILGDKDHIASPGDLNKYKNKLGYVEGQNELFDPTSPGRDYFSNGLLDIKNLDGDPNIDKIDDLLHFQNVASAGMPTPPVFFGVDVKSVNRDAIEDMRELYYKSTTTCYDSITEPIRHALELAWLMEDIPPENVDYALRGSVSSLEQPTQRVSWVCQAIDYGLITRGHAAFLLNDVFEIHDIPAEIAAAKKEQEDMMKLESELSAKPMSLSASPTKAAKRTKAVATNTKSNGKLRNRDVPEQG